LKKIIFFLSSIFWIIGTSLPVSAETQSNTTPNVQFSLEYPNNQDSGTKGYYKLAMQPGQQQIIYINLINSKDQSIHLNVLNTNALTTQNGGINYTESKGSDLSYILTNSFLASQYIQVQKGIDLPGHSQKQLPIKINAPHKNGTFLSGILFTTAEKRQQNTKMSVQINSEVRVGTAIQLNVGQPEKATLKIKESITKVYPSGIQIQTRVENPSSTIVKSYELQYKVYNEQNQVLFTGGSNQYDMAPQTGIMFPANWNSSKISSGKYRIEFTIKGDGETYSKTNEFMVKNTDLKTYQKTNVTSDNKPVVENNNHTLVYSLIGIIIVLVIYIVLGKRKRKKE
jgi:hypothetical protein